jgi:hypothetical protein
VLHGSLRARTLAITITCKSGVLGQFGRAV